MIDYKTDYFGLLFALSLRGSIIPKTLCVACPVSVLSALLYKVGNDWADLAPSWSFNTAMGGLWTGFTFVLGFMIVFRSQQAYSRWWEGGSLLKEMRGEWFNAYSSLLAFTTVEEDRQEEVKAFQAQVVRLFSLLHALSLELVADSGCAFETIELTGFDKKTLIALQSVRNKPEVVIQWIQKLIVKSDASGILKVAPPILSRVYNQLANGMVNCSNACKIGEYPFPFPLSQLTTFMLCIQMTFTIYASVIFLTGAGEALTASFVITFAFWSAQYVSMELEMPFGSEANDIPLQALQKDFNLSLSTLLLDEFITAPAYKYDAASSQLYVHEGSLAHYLESFQEKGGKPDFAKNATSRKSLAEIVRAGTFEEEDTENTKPAAGSKRRRLGSIGGSATPEAIQNQTDEFVGMDQEGSTGTEESQEVSTRATPRETPPGSDQSPQPVQDPGKKRMELTTSSPSECQVGSDPLAPQVAGPRSQIAITV